MCCWIPDQLGKIPAAGETYTYENLDIIVTKANNKRVLEVKVKVNPVEEEPESGLEKLLGAVRSEKSVSEPEKNTPEEEAEPVLIGGKSKKEKSGNN